MSTDTHIEEIQEDVKEELAKGLDGLAAKVRSGKVSRLSMSSTEDMVDTPSGNVPSGLGTLKIVKWLVKPSQAPSEAIDVPK